MSPWVCKGRIILQQRVGDLADMFEVTGVRDVLHGGRQTVHQTDA